MQRSQLGNPTLMRRRVLWVDPSHTSRQSNLAIPTVSRSAMKKPASGRYRTKSYLRSA
jgi:hypothetical protein